MINRELIEVFSEIAREKNVERSELASIMEDLFLYVIEREYGDSSNCSCIVNLDKGEIEIYAEKTIVDEVDDYKVEITLEDAFAKEPDAVDGLKVGDIFVEVVDLRLFGRRLITTAKQFFAQRLRELERNYIYEDYANRIGEIVIGTVHQVQRDNVFINIEQAELRMPKKEQIQSERYRRNDTVRAVIISVEVTSKGPDIVVSRSDNHFLHKLFEMEVPEIEDAIIEITSIARYPGERAKIIVRSNDRRIDPVGACVGMRGSRIQAIVRELNNEKIDIVNYSDQPEILITRALSPAKPVNLYIDEEKAYCVAIFDDDNLDSAIGRRGVNINLASRISGYRIDVYGEKQYQRIQNDQNTPLTDVKGIAPTVAQNLSTVGVKLVSDLLDADENILLSVKGVGDKTLEGIYDSVQKFIERIDETFPDEEKLINLDADQELENTETSGKASKTNSDEKIEITSDSYEHPSDKDNGIGEEVDSNTLLPDDQPVIDENK